MQAFQESIYELEQRITQGDIECDFIRNEIVRNNGKMDETLTDTFYAAKAKAIQRYLLETMQ